MKRFLLATTLIGCLAANAHAQTPVVDWSLNALSQSSFGKDAVSWAQQATDMSSSIAKATATVNQLTTTYQMLSNPMTMLSVAPSLLTGGATSPLGQDVSATIGLARGIGRLGSTLTNAADSIRSTNFYLPDVNASSAPFMAQMLLNRANQTAGIQAQVQQLMTSMSSRMQGLTELQAQVNLGGDVNQMASLSARVSTEVAMTNAQAAQASQLTALAQLQEQAGQQQMAQKVQYDHQDYLNDAVTRSGGLVNFSSSTTATTATSAAALVPAFSASTP